MKMKLKIHTFLDTMNPGCWIATVLTIVDGVEHGFYTEGATEAVVIADACQALEDFIIQVRKQS